MAARLMTVQARKLLGSTLSGEEVWLLGQPLLHTVLDLIEKTAVREGRVRQSHLLDQWRTANDVGVGDQLRRDPKLARMIELNFELKGFGANEFGPVI